MAHFPSHLQALLSARKGTLTPRFTGFAFLVAAWLTPAVLHAQTVSTVREAEFRSRWTDYQVDKAAATRKEEGAEAAAEAETGEVAKPDLVTRFTQFGPLEFHGSLTTGWEYSDERQRIDPDEEVTNSSFYVAPSLLAFYAKEFGTWNVEARYSIGWLYYLDPNYSGSSGDITTSQTASLALLRMNDRVTIRSITNASSGNGFDIERGQQVDRVNVGETFSVEYHLAEHLRTGVSGTWGYESSTTQGDALVTTESSNHRYAGAAYLDHFWTDKTAYRLELSAGSDTQENGPGNSNERTYAQGVARINYSATAKLAFTASIGLGVRDESQSANEEANGLRAVYSLTTTYTPSEKTSVRLYVGVVGAASQPEFTLAINWHPREFTFLELSVYQLTGLSNLTTSDERLSKGFLASFRQRLFGRVEASLSGGYEQTETIVGGESVAEQEPYSFIATGLGWQMNKHLSLQTQVRRSTRRNALMDEDSSQQTRASMSLSLTF